MTDFSPLQNWKPPWGEVTIGSLELKSLWASWRHIRKENACLWFLWDMEKQQHLWKMMGRKDMLNEHHHSKMAGHLEEIGPTCTRD